MDGGKKRLIGSLRLKLSLGLSSAIVIVALAAGIFSFYSSFEEAHELQDSTLEQIANLARNERFSVLQQRDSAVTSNIGEAAIIVQWLPSTRKSEAHFLENTSVKPGFQTLAVEGETFRVLVLSLTPQLQLAVAQRTSERDEIALASAWRTLLPLLILIPILLLVVADLIKKGMQPIARYARELELRGERDLTPLSAEGLPGEILPFVVSINRLFGKVSTGVETQRRFVDDAAHELRSPLTALSLQAERLGSVEMSVLAQQRLERLHQGILRLRHLLEQLLSLARVQQNARRSLTRVSIQAVFRQVIEEALPFAEAKNIDLGVCRPQEISLTLNEMELFTLVRNLVENAIRYTPCGGVVDMQARVEGRYVILEVEDSGPGIVLEQRQRVLDAFYRIEGAEPGGAGLGLSIVCAILAQMEGRLFLSDAVRHASGLKAIVVLPQR
ncbi:Sensor protein QseC [Serratia plymuthica]|uniref:ATP-binding protein n=1 Tax=Serratia plymuthica TaxID=82996 RepID=UPI00034CBC65|nr:ATP-binding protein [Serratia plymuthica]QJW55538.1 Sensor protein QseC [Serratia plymuthica]